MITKEVALEFYRGVGELYKAQDMHDIRIGRELENKKIKEFIEKNRENKDSGLLYLCGHPGTGKTTLLN